MPTKGPQLTIAATVLPLSATPSEAASGPARGGADRACAPAAAGPGPGDLRVPGWATRGVCAARSDPDALFVTGAAQRDAAKLCAGCPVKTECLADALDHRVEYGVWGGMTERQRRALLRRVPQVTSWRRVLEDARADVLRASAG